jgi:hypothetical protein
MCTQAGTHGDLYATTSGNEKTVNFREFRKNLSGYLQQARQGSHFVVTTRGEEVASAPTGAAAY